jgi:hypothetical protein
MASGAGFSLDFALQIRMARLTKIFALTAKDCKGNYLPRAPEATKIGVRSGKFTFSFFGCAAVSSPPHFFDRMRRPLLDIKSKKERDAPRISLKMECINRITPDVLRTLPVLDRPHRKCLWLALRVLR